MKKFSLLLTVISLACLQANAQRAYEGKIKYKKVEQPALVIEYDYPGEVVENALKAKMADLRIKGGSSRGFLTYNNAVIPEVTKNKLDYSFKTETAGKKGKEKTTLYMLMEGSSNISGDAMQLAANGKSFLEGLSTNVRQSHTIIQIKKQEDLLVSEEKKLKTLKDDYKGLEKKMKANESEQEKQSKIIASQKSILDDLKK